MVIRFLIELYDKSPADSYLSDEILEDLANYQFYIDGVGVEKRTDVLGMAMINNGILLSLCTSTIWDNEIITIFRTPEPGKEHQRHESFDIQNISKPEHGKIINHILFDEKIDLTPDGFSITQHLKDWFDQLIVENKYRLKSKIEYVKERDFKVSEPLIKPIEEFHEIRVSAYSGGAIRVLFKNIQGNQPLLLTGWIKKGVMMVMNRIKELLEG